MTRRRVRALGALIAVAAAGAALLPPARGAVRDLAKGVVAAPALFLRASLPPEEPLFVRLAASQVGYGPAARKRFSSPTAFGSFRLVREPGGEVALRGGGPLRAVEADVAGAGRRAWIGDFSALAAPGRYRVVADNGLESFPFDVGPAVYDGAVRAVQRAFYFQRAFTAVEERYAEGPWHHPSDAHLAPPGERGGWHDAGDLSLYGASTSSALFWLLSAHADFGPGEDVNIPESGDGVPDLLDEARWGLEWLLSVQERSGAFRNTTCQEHYGRYGTVFPHTAGRYRAGEPGTVATARAVGTLAFAAVVLREAVPDLSARCLGAAREGWRYLEARPGESSDGPTCAAMRQDGDAGVGRELRLYAAAGLLLATGEARFREAFDESWVPPEGDPSYLHFGPYAALLYLRSPAGDPTRKAEIWRLLGRGEARAGADAATHPFEWSPRYFWGSIAAAFQRGAGFAAPGCLADPARAEEACELALSNVHYALGRNSRHLAYVSGLRGVTRGRVRAFHHWLAALEADPFLFPGLVAGGPSADPEPSDRSVPHAWRRPIWGYFGDPAMPRDAATPVDGRYTDNDSFSTNELDVDWQGVTYYNLRLAQWWARGAPARPGARLAYAPPGVDGP